MKKLKLYLDTSIFNFVFAEDAPKERDVTLKFFEQIGQFDAYISDLVVKEIDRCPEDKKKKLFDLILQYDFEELAFDQAAKELADKYVQENIIPEKYRDDAFHIAIASVNNIDAVVSWNFAHMVKLKTKREVVGVNLLMGYKEIDIYSPWEVAEYV